MHIIKCDCKRCKMQLQHRKPPHQSSSNTIKSRRFQKSILPALTATRRPKTHPCNASFLRKSVIGAQDLTLIHSEINQCRFITSAFTLDRLLCFLLNLWHLDCGTRLQRMSFAQELGEEEIPEAVGRSLPVGAGHLE